MSSYQIKRTDGTLITTIEQGKINTTSTSIKLIGKKYADYGEVLNKNLVWILENFANGTAPSNPMTGQLWYNTTGTGDLKVYNSSSWKSVNQNKTVISFHRNVQSSEFPISGSQLMLFRYDDLTTLQSFLLPFDAQIKTVNVQTSRSLVSGEQITIKSSINDSILSATNIEPILNAGYSSALATDVNLLTNLSSNDTLGSYAEFTGFTAGSSSAIEIMVEVVLQF